MLIVTGCPFVLTQLPLLQKCKISKAKGVIGWMFSSFDMVEESIQPIAYSIS